MSHQRLPMVQMPCHQCKEVSDGVCQISQPSGEGIAAEYVCAECCPLCKPAAPLPEREVGTLAGQQGALFGGGE